MLIPVTRLKQANDSLSSYQHQKAIVAEADGGGAFLHYGTRYKGERWSDGVEFFAQYTIAVFLFYWCIDFNREPMTYDGATYNQVAIGPFRYQWIN